MTDRIEKTLDDIKSNLQWVCLMSMILLFTSCTNHSKIDRLNNKIEKLQEEILNVERNTKTAS